MVYTPYLRFNYYDQMVMVFTQYKSIVSPDVVNTFIGDLALAEGVIVLFFYIIGGQLADKFSEKYTFAAGGILMGLATFWYAAIPDATSLIIIHILLGVGVGLLWGAYIKLTRKLGTAAQQSRVYSTSEFIRGILGTALGFFGVAVLGQAILPTGATDPTLVGQQFSLLLIVNASIFIVLSVLLLILIPKNVIGLEVDEGKEIKEEKFTIKTAAKVLKMPGVWMVAMIIFFCYSVTAAASGYLGAFTTSVLGITTTQASSFAIIRNYIIAALSTLAIGFVAAKIGSEVKTLGWYLGISAVLMVIMIITQGASALCIVITFVFAVSYTGMRGIYFAQLHEVRIPIELTGVATGIISVICYLPDVYFARLAGSWLDAYGSAGYSLIWGWAIGCAVLGIVTVFITRRYIKKLNAHDVEKTSELVD